MRPGGRHGHDERQLDSQTQPWTRRGRSESLGYRHSEARKPTQTSTAEAVTTFQCPEALIRIIGATRRTFQPPGAYSLQVVSPPVIVLNRSPVAPSRQET
jgi:hypothetical protein